MLLFLPTFLTLLHTRFIEVPISDVILFHSTPIDLNIINTRKISKESKYHNNIAAVKFNKDTLLGESWAKENPRRIFKRPIVLIIEVTNEFIHNNNNNSIKGKGPYFSLLDSFTLNSSSSSSANESFTSSGTTTTTTLNQIPWIFFLYCETDSIEIDLQLLHSFAMLNIPQAKYQLNSHIYFVTCSFKVFEIYFIKKHLFLNRIFTNSTDDFYSSLLVESATFRRTNFQNQTVVIGFAVRNSLK